MHMQYKSHHAIYKSQDKRMLYVMFLHKTVRYTCIQVPTIKHSRQWFMIAVKFERLNMHNPIINFSLHQSLVTIPWKDF